MRCGSCKEPPSLRHALRALSAAPGRAKPPQSLAQWVSPKWGRSMESLDETRENEGYLCERSKTPPPSWDGPLRSATGMLREGRRGLFPTVCTATTTMGAYANALRTDLQGGCTCCHARIAIRLLIFLRRLAGHSVHDVSSQFEENAKRTALSS